MKLEALGPDYYEVRCTVIGEEDLANYMYWRPQIVMSNMTHEPVKFCCGAMQSVTVSEFNRNWFATHGDYERIEIETRTNKIVLNWYTFVEPSEASD